MQARYEVVIIGGGVTRVITRTRRENGAIAERDIAADGHYRNWLKRTKDGSGRVVRGSDAKDPNAEVIVYWDDEATQVATITYRPV